MEEKLEILKQWVNESTRMVFFGGAGVSTESGIPDFRSVDGLYHQQYDYPPETILSHTFYMRKPEEFYRFYRAKMLAPDAKPNAAHRKLAQWEQEGKLSAVVTQNIDGLHQAAGRFMNCMGPCAEIIAGNAARFMILITCCAQRGFPAAKNAEESSSRMWCCMRKDWIRPH